MTKISKNKSIKSSVFSHLKKEEDIINELRDTKLHIKDLEAEYEFLLTREPDDVKYIAIVKKHIDDLYNQLDSLYNEYNKI